MLFIFEFPLLFIVVIAKYRLSCCHPCTQCVRYGQQLIETFYIWWLHFELPLWKVCWKVHRVQCTAFVLLNLLYIENQIHSNVNVICFPYLGIEPFELSYIHYFCVDWFLECCLRFFLSVAKRSRTIDIQRINIFYSDYNNNLCEGECICHCGVRTLNSILNQ